MGWPDLSASSPIILVRSSTALSTGQASPRTIATSSALLNFHQPKWNTSPDPAKAWRFVQSCRRLKPLDLALPITSPVNSIPLTCMAARMAIMDSSAPPLESIRKVIVFLPFSMAFRMQSKTTSTKSALKSPNTGMSRPPFFRQFCEAWQTY